MNCSRGTRALLIAMSFLLALASGSAQALDRVRVAKSGLAIAFAPIEVGTEAEIWQSVGIEVESILLGGDAAVERALTAGEIDIGLGSGPSMGYRVKGVPAIAVAAAAGPPNSFKIVVRPDSTIRSDDALKGARIAVTSAGSLTDWLVRELAQQKGWGPDGIQSIPLGGQRSEMAAMKAGDVDGVVVTSGPAYDYEEHKEARVLLSFGNIVKDFHTHVLVASDALIANNPDLLRRFLKGWFETIAFMKSHPEIGIRIAGHALNISESACAKAYPGDMAMMSDDGVFNPAAIETIRKSLPELGILDSVPDAKALYTDRFVPVKF
ncbi:MAG TPA: ABC transporter substrate-binding protein [Stellaceae bacterium]|nr:ABC transporter substrate-binding protein [Stellaceae bacterium]